MLWTRFRLERSWGKFSSTVGKFYKKIVTLVPRKAIFGEIFPKIVNFAIFGQIRPSIPLFKQISYEFSKFLVRTPRKQN